MNQYVETRDEEKDLIATGHLVEAYESGLRWDCKCEACQYLRTAPKVVFALQSGLGGSLLQVIDDEIWENLMIT